MLGHAEISTTQIYTQVAIRQLVQVHARTHPGARRRVRGQEPNGRQGAQTSVDVATPWSEDEAGAEGLLEALAGEADEEDAA